MSNFRYAKYISLQQACGNTEFGKICLSGLFEIFKVKRNTLLFSRQISCRPCKSTKNCQDWIFWSWFKTGSRPPIGSFLLKCDMWIHRWKDTFNGFLGSFCNLLEIIQIKRSSRLPYSWYLKLHCSIDRCLPSSPLPSIFLFFFLWNYITLHFNNLLIIFCINNTSTANTRRNLSNIIPYISKLLILRSFRFSAFAALQGTLPK